MKIAWVIREKHATQKWQIYIDFYLFSWQMKKKVWCETMQSLFIYVALNMLKHLSTAENQNKMKIYKTF